mmetsp:Transcript_29086/g.41147  ORF Transcript_29086/g.41147 Transcript_29086/m.41147 type:complete len:538 (-) Transcript_29086:45-1658(-)|eukprot:CAMPEP_0202452992 /NCGR_PEP_ID=MMETSP1360-20130828/11084_1 /ASSEMBLY_ACC=CAM_ASM_000848 /TAXON_ID=515479 /ORGANISM="Licmophora paradoxa, Strain CCMP2313" /LENGTH=537 /DNA_ID=CAMNT_0049071979 /DNA_START=190 /DNA_END=1803 /DNA_ORIENTATION=-
MDHNSNKYQQDEDKDGRIAALERKVQAQQDEISDLRRHIGEEDATHKQEVYWLRLEMDELRREKEDVEDRIDTLYRDLKEFDQELIEREPNPDAEYVADLQSQLGKALRTLEILEQQTSMVKASCDEVVKSLKEEIADVMEDKIRMEMDLLNQLASLDGEKRDIEMEFEEQVKQKDEKISELKQGIGVVDGNRSDEKKREEDLLNEISGLKSARRKLEDKLDAERNDADDAIERLKEANQDLEQQIESMTSDLEVMRQGAAAEAVQVLDALTRDRQETLTTLERVAMIWEKADDSIQALEDVMDELRPHDEDHVHGDRERLLSTLETASLVHGQIKVSLLLVELKLRNQLSSLKNDKLRMGGSAAVDDLNLTERMKEIQQEALTALDQVEDSLTDQIKQLEHLTREETSHVKDTLEERTEELRSMQSQHRKLEAEISRLREEDSRKDFTDSGRSNGSSDTSVSRAVLERLQNEIITVVDRMKEKNEVIGRLQTANDELKVREIALKKELKRMMKKQRGSSGDDENGGRSSRRGTGIR